MHNFSDNLMCYKIHKKSMFVHVMPHYKNKYSIFLKIFFGIWKICLSLCLINH